MHATGTGMMRSCPTSVEVSNLKVTNERDEDPKRVKLQIKGKLM